MEKSLMPIELIEKKIFLIRGQKVMIDSDLAQLYGVSTKVFNQAIKRNFDRFPEDFMFRLNKEESESLRSQFVTLKRGQHRKYLPHAFTEQGIAMLSSILRSKRAVHVNITIMRAFVRLRQILSTHKELAYKFDQLENKVGALDSEVKAIFHAIKRLMEEPVKKHAKKIGFRP